MDEDEEHWFDETDENENGDTESKEENGAPASEEEPTSSKYTPLTSVKSLAPINAAPPVKRTLLVRTALLELIVPFSCCRGRVGG